jgi:integrase/recombinase XerD
MLSDKLLEILRSYWKVERPKEWLFPGAYPGRPITRGAIERACQKAQPRAGLSRMVKKLKRQGRGQYPRSA